MTSKKLIILHHNQQNLANRNWWYQRLEKWSWDLLSKIKNHSLTFDWRKVNWFFVLLHLRKKTAKKKSTRKIGNILFGFVFHLLSSSSKHFVVCRILLFVIIIELNTFCCDQITSALKNIYQSSIVDWKLWLW